MRVVQNLMIVIDHIDPKVEAVKNKRNKEQDNIGTVGGKLTG